MKKTKLATLLAAVVTFNISSQLIQPLADEISTSMTLMEKQQTSKTTIKKTDILNDSNIDEYNERYKIPNFLIRSITSNGGHNLSSTLDKAIDGNLNTHWESGKRNTSDFFNEVIITLDDQMALSRILYTARNDSASTGKGFPRKLEIYASPTEYDDDFKLVAQGEYRGSATDTIEIKFPTTICQRIKFRYIEVERDWPSAAEFMLYREDQVSDKMERLFTNGLMDTVSDEFNNKNAIAALEKEVNRHPFKSKFQDDIELAKKIVNGEDIGTVKVITAEQNGDMVAHARDNLKFGFGNSNRQPTGIAAKPGDKITVFVDADPTQPLPQLLFTQQEGSFTSWSSKQIDLKPGRNIITVPEIPFDGNYKHNVTKGGSVYLINPYTKDQQPKAPVIRFAGGEAYPFLTKESNDEEFKEYLIEYKKKIDEDIAKNPNVLDREVLDIFEFASDHIVFTGTATGAYEAYIKKGYNPLDTIKLYNNHMDEIFRYYGLDGSNEKNDPKYIRENVRLAQPYGYMYASGSHIGVQRDVMASILTDASGWGLNHEIGHRMDIPARTYVEVTNNMLPQYMSGYYNRMDNRIPFDKVYKNVIDSHNFNPNKNLLESLAVFWQLELHYPGYWAGLNRLYRENNVSLGNTNPDNAKMQYLIKFSSQVIGEDLSEYFARHGFKVNDETKEETSKYPKPSSKIWYLNNKKFGYKGNGFTTNTRTTLGLSYVNNGIKLRFDVDSSVKKDLLGYEILKDGKVIAFTTNNEFIDVNADRSKNYKYEVIPYDLNLKAGSSVILNSREDLASKVSITASGVNYAGTVQKVGLKIYFDFTDKKLYPVNRLTESIHAGFGNTDYFSFRLLDKNKNEKLSINMKGNDRPNDPKYNKLDFVDFEIGDFVEVQHAEPFRLDIQGGKQQNKKALYKITEDGLKIVSQ